MELGQPQIHRHRRQVHQRTRHAVAQVPGHDPHPIMRPPLLGLQGTTLLVIGHLGGDHLQDPAPQDPQLTRREVRRVRQQALLRPPPHHRAHVGRQRLQGVHDHLDLSRSDRPVAQRGTRSGVPLVDRVRQPLPPPPLPAIGSASGEPATRQPTAHPRPPRRRPPTPAPPTAAPPAGPACRDNPSSTSAFASADRYVGSDAATPSSSLGHRAHTPHQRVRQKGGVLAHAQTLDATTDIDPLRGRVHDRRPWHRDLGWRNDLHHCQVPRPARAR